MNDELERLRDVVRALVAERRAFTVWSETMNLRRSKELKPTEESIQEMRRLATIHFDRKRDLDAALARLAEVNPELVNG